MAENANTKGTRRKQPGMPAKALAAAHAAAASASGDRSPSQSMQQTPVTVGSIRQRIIQAANISGIDREVLDVELDGVIKGLGLSVEQAADWIERSIRIHQSLMPERAETHREIEAVFAGKQP